MTERVHTAISEWLGKHRASQCTNVNNTQTMMGGTIHTWSPIQDEIKASDLHEHLRGRFPNAHVEVSTSPVSDVVGASTLIVTTSPKPSSGNANTLASSSWPLLLAVCIVLVSFVYVMVVISQQRRR